MAKNWRISAKQRRRKKESFNFNGNVIVIQYPILCPRSFHTVCIGSNKITLETKVPTKKTILLPYFGVLYSFFLFECNKNKFIFALCQIIWKLIDKSTFVKHLNARHFADFGFKFEFNFNFDTLVLSILL